MIFGYVSFFRLEELSIEDYRKLVMSQDSVKMNTFLQFVFNADMLRENVRDAWMELYDYQYIDDKIIGGIEKNLPSVTDILKVVEKKATGKVTQSFNMSNRSTTDKDSETFSQGLTAQSHANIDEEVVPKKITIQQPFNLTKPKPKVIPQPESLPRAVKANPVPEGMFDKGLE